jgi:hypothetical protein
MTLALDRMVAYLRGAYFPYMTLFTECRSNIHHITLAVNLSKRKGRRVLQEKFEMADSHLTQCNIVSHGRRVANRPFTTLSGHPKDDSPTSASDDLLADHDRDRRSMRRRSGTLLAGRRATCTCSSPRSEALGRDGHGRTECRLVFPRSWAPRSAATSMSARSWFRTSH